MLNSKVLFGEEQVLDFIRAQCGKVKVVVNDKIREEYKKEVPHPLQVETRLLELGRCLLRATGGPVEQGEVKGLRKHHSNFVTEALSTQCRYLVTRWPQFHALSNALGNDFGLTVIYPEDFVRELGQHP